MPVPVLIAFAFGIYVGMKFKEEIESLLAEDEAPEATIRRWLGLPPFTLEVDK